MFNAADGAPLLSGSTAAASPVGSTILMSPRGLALAAAAATAVAAGGAAAGVLLSPGGGGAGAAFPTPAELSNTAACTAALGSPDVSRFRVALPLGDSPYGRSTSKPVFFPLFASARLDAPNSTVETALIVLHGLSGDANDYFCNALAAVWATGGVDPSTVAVVAPWFGDEQVPSSYWDATLKSAASMFWTTSRWLYGGNNSPGPASDPPVQWSTSFDALDALVAAARAGQWPKLKRVVLAGYSAGAQLASRYAWARHDAGGGGDGGAPLRVLVSDPGSFLYLDDTRPAAECRPLRDTFANATACASFPVPPPDSGCAATYDEWKYGVGGGLDATLYTAPLAGDAAAVAAQTAAFAARDTRYALGTGDACNCNTQGYDNAADCIQPGLTCTPDAFGGPGCCDTFPDSTTSNAMDVTCEAMLQGSNRLQRGKLYADHLARALPGYAPPLAFFEGGHNASAFYASAAFKEWAFTG